MITDSEKQLMLAILRLQESVELNPDSVLDMFEDVQITQHYDEFDEYMNDFIFSLEGNYSSARDYNTIKILIDANFVSNEDLYETILKNPIISNIEDTYIRKLIVNLIISYKCLLLVKLKGELIEDIEKSEILKIKELCKDMIDYALSKNLNTNDKDFKNQVLQEIEKQSNNFICKVVA